MMDSSWDMSRAILDEFFGIDVMHFRLGCRKGVKMAHGGRCLGLMQTGRLHAWINQVESPSWGPGSYLSYLAVKGEII